MPRLNSIDRNAPQAPVRRFVLTDNVKSLRLQIAAEPEVRDEQGRKTRDGVSKTVTFENGMLVTNRHDWIDGVMASYAFGDGKISDMDVLDTKAKEDRRSKLLAEVKDDPEFRAKLNSLLTEIEVEEDREAMITEKTKVETAVKQARGLEAVRQSLNLSEVNK